MNKRIEIHNNKSLRLDNVLIRNIVEMSLMNNQDDSEDDESPIDLEVDKMINEIRVRGANQIGPLIQYSGTSAEQDDLQIRVSLMIQADRYINNVSAPYRMEPVIQVKNCMYTRFVGAEDDMHYAYQKIQVTAYEEGITLKGNSYTVFVDSDENGIITADIFMEKENA